MIKVICEDIIDRIETKIDKFLEPIVSTRFYNLEYDFYRNCYLLYLYKGISPETVINKMLDSKQLTRYFEISMDRSEPRQILLRLRRDIYD